MKDVFNVLRPDDSTPPVPLVFDSPHSGTVYPDDFHYACNHALLSGIEDKYVDELYKSAPDAGAVLLSANFPRSYIDANRCALDIDEKLLAAPWPDETNPSVRSYAGIGLIHRLVKPGIPIYDRALSVEEVRRRIDTCYRPYHDMLETLLDEAHNAYGQVWHINCHSMASHSISIPLKGPSDFVLGDRSGTSCDLDFTHAVRDCLKRMGYNVSINDPYKGVELVRRYSSPAAGRHSLQIEICKSLYMNEETFEKSPSFESFQKDIEKLIRFCADYVESQTRRIAAD